MAALAWGSCGVGGGLLWDFGGVLGGWCPAWESHWPGRYCGDVSYGMGVPVGKGDSVRLVPCPGVLWCGVGVPLGVCEEVLGGWLLWGGGLP